MIIDVLPPPFKGIRLVWLRDDGQGWMTPDGRCFDFMFQALAYMTGPVLVNELRHQWELMRLNCDYWEYYLNLVVDDLKRRPTSP